jgi:hypothetical protein
MRNDILARELSDWFANNQNNRSRWCDNPVGQTLKKCLERCGNWKNKRRGDPAKGMEVKRRNEYIRQGVELMDEENRRERGDW